MVDHAALIRDFPEPSEGLELARAGWEHCDSLVTHTRAEEMITGKYLARRFLSTQRVPHLGESGSISSMPGAENPAGGLTKVRSDVAPLLRILESGRFRPGIPRPLKGGYLRGGMLSLRVVSRRFALGSSPICVFLFLWLWAPSWPSFFRVFGSSCSLPTPEFVGGDQRVLDVIREMGPSEVRPDVSGGVAMNLGVRPRATSKPELRQADVLSDFSAHKSDSAASPRANCHSQPTVVRMGRKGVAWDWIHGQVRELGKQSGMAA